VSLFILQLIALDEETKKEICEINIRITKLAPFPILFKRKKGKNV